MKSNKNILIAILIGLLVLSLTSQPSQGADSPVTRAEFDALKNKLISAQSNLDELKKNIKTNSVEVDVLVAHYERGSSLVPGRDFSGCPRKQAKSVMGTKYLDVGYLAFNVCPLKLLILP